MAWTSFPGDIPITSDIDIFVLEYCGDKQVDRHEPYIIRACVVGLRKRSGIHLVPVAQPVNRTRKLDCSPIRRIHCLFKRHSDTTGKSAI